MKKKIISIMLFILLFCACTISVNASTPVIVSDYFESTPTNARPLKAHVIGDGSVVLAQVSGEGNKVLVLKNRYKQTTVFYEVSNVSEKTVFEMRFMVNDFNSKKHLLEISDGTKWVSLLNLDTDGSLKDTEGNKLGKTIEKTKYYTVTALLDTATRKVQIYLDNENIGSEKVFSQSFQALEKIGFTSLANEQSETVLNCDFIRMYEGSSIKADTEFVKEEYNPITKENYTSQVTKKEEKPKTIYNMDFDSYTTSDSLSGIDKTANPENQKIITESDTGNHFLRLGANTQTNVLMWYYEKDFYPDTVIGADYRIGSNNKGKVDFLLRDIYDTGGEYYPLYIDKDGYFYYERNSFGNYFSPVRIGNKNCKENWVNVSVAVHFITKTIDIYIDGVLEAKDIPFKFPDMSFNMYHIRYRVPESSGENAIFDIDNIFIYKAEKYHDPETLEGVGGGILEEDIWNYPIDQSAIEPDMTVFEKVEEPSFNAPAVRLTDYSEAKAVYNGAVCFAENTKNMWIKDGKYASSYKVIRENDVLLASGEVLAALINKKAHFSEDKKTITIGNVNATVGNSYIENNGEIINLKCKVVEKNGTVYIPIEEFAVHIMKKWYGYSNLGFCVIANEKKDIHFEVDSNRAYLYTVDNSSHMMAYLIMQQPDTQKLKTIFDAKNHGERPYATANGKEFSYIKNLMESDSVASDYSHLVMLQANSLLNSSYTSNDTPGTQSSPVFSMKEPWVLYWAYYASGDRRYAQKAEELALQMANLSHWSEDFHFLQTAQAMSSAAYFYDLFYNEFSESTKDILANAIINKGILPAKRYYEGSGEGVHQDWCTRNTNWNNIPNNALMIAASTLLGEGYDDALCLETIERAFVSLGYFMHYYSPGGGGGESIGYTNYTLSYLLPAIDCLNRVFGTDFGITDYPGFWETGRYATNASSYRYSYTLNDDSAEGMIDQTGSLWFAKKMQDDTLAKTIMEFLEKNPSLKYSYSATVLKYYFDFDEDTKEKMPLDAFYDEAGVAFSRSTHKDDGVFLGIHSGYNNIAHGRYDYGTFEFDAFGIRFANEPGYEGYEPSGYGSFVENGQYYTIRPEGHNVYVVNPDIEPGQNRYTKSHINIQEKKDKGIIYTIDMHQAYSGYVKDAKRSYMLTNDRNVFVLQDEITPFENSYDDFYWFWHTYADVEIDNENKIVTLTRENRTVKLYFDCNVDVYLSCNNVAPLPSSPNPDTQLKSQHLKDMKKITAMFFGNGAPITFRVIAEPMGQNYERGELVPSSLWSIPDGVIDEEAYERATEIIVNNTIIAEFSPDKYDYTVSYSNGTQIPTVSARSNGLVEITQATADNKVAVIRVSSIKYPENCKVYTVSFKESEPLNITGEYVDCDFESYTTLTGDKSTENFFIYYNRGGSSVIKKDEIRENKVLEYTLQSADENGHTLDFDSCVHIDKNIVYTNTEWDGAVLEFSFMLDDNAHIAATMFGVPFLETGRDGYFYGVNGTEKIKLGAYTLNKWHNVKIVFDNVDKYNQSFSRVYVYVDSKNYMKTANADNSSVWNCSFITQKNFTAAEARFTLYTNQSSRYKVYLDDIKLYTTKGSPYEKIDIDSDFYGTQVLTDCAVNFNTDSAGGKIYVKKDVTLSDLNEKITTENGESVSFYIGMKKVSFDAYEKTPAVGCRLYIKGTTGRLIAVYEISEGKSAYETDWYVLKNGEIINAPSELGSGDVLQGKALFKNFSTMNKKNILVLALYSDNKLVKVVTEEFNAKAYSNTEQILTKTITVGQENAPLKVKAFVFDDMKNLVPLVKGYELK